MQILYSWSRKSRAHLSMISVSWTESLRAGKFVDFASLYISRTRSQCLTRSPISNGGAPIADPSALKTAGPCLLCRNSVPRALSGLQIQAEDQSKPTLCRKEHHSASRPGARFRAGYATHTRPAHNLEEWSYSPRCSSSKQGCCSLLS